MGILKIILNQEDKGEFFVHVTDDGDYLIRVEDLRSMGFSEPEGKVSEIAGEKYLSIRSMEGVEFKFNEKALSLEITADPRLFKKSIFNLRYPRQPKVYFTKDTGAFLNYGIGYSASKNFEFDRFDVANQLGFRTGDFLFLSDSSYTKQADTEKFIRLMSNITYDRREKLERAIFGDFFASSGDLGSTVNMGGITLSRNYRIDPYFIKHPEIGFSGLLSLPSEIEIYRDGMLIRREKLSPGGFELKDVPVYVGSGTVEVVIKDIFGREQRLKHPFYFSDRLLKEGLHEYSYNIGYLREGFGQKSFSYGDWVFSGFHRLGLSDSFTAGGSAEATKGLFNAGLSSSYLTAIGVLDASIAWSNSDGGENGFASSIGYSYQGQHAGVNLLLRGFTEDYSNISIRAGQEKVKYEASAGISYAAEKLGSISLGLSESKKYQGFDTRSAAITYSRNLIKNSNMFVTLRRSKQIEYITEFFAGFHYYFKGGVSSSVNYQTRDGSSSEAIQVQKNLPLGEGIGYRASLEHSRDNGNTSDAFDAMLQYNAKYGLYTGQFRKAEETEAYNLSAAGSISYIGNSLNLSRPIRDSYGLVKVGDLKGVRVYYNNQEMGRTNSSGEVLIPEILSYYDNQISIEDKDIPMEYAISEVVKYVSPAYRSGAYIKFDLTKIQAITGRLRILKDGETHPVEFYEVKFFVDSKEVTFPTGKGGEFYIENIKPNKYKAVFNYMGKDCFFDIIIPESEDMLIDLGEITCEYGV